MRFHAKAGWLGMGIVLGLTTWTMVSAQPTAADKRTPIPDKAAQAKAAKEIDSIFDDLYVKAKGPFARIQLAEKIFREGQKSGDFPVERYICYLKARDMAAQAGSSNSLAYIEELAIQFVVSPQQVLDMRTVALAEMADATVEFIAGAEKRLKTAPDTKTKTDAVFDIGEGKKHAKVIVELIMPIVNEAVAADNYDVAVKLAKVAKSTARLTKLEPLMEKTDLRLAEILEVQKGFASIQTLLNRVRKDPQDSEANLELGKYYAFLKGNWDKALPYLARGGPFKDLAVQDLARPKDPHQQLALADGWWELGGKEKDPARFALQVRAANWYMESARDLKGLSQLRAYKRVEIVKLKLDNMPGEAPPGPVGEIKKMEGHTEDVKCVAVSPDGRYAVSAGLETKARIWNLATGKEEKALSGHSKQIWGVSFRQSSREVMTVSWDATARLWDVKTGEEIRRFTHRLDVNGLALSRDGNQMLTGCDDHSVYLWNVQTGEEIRRFTGHTNFVYCVAFAPDGRHFASGDTDKQVRVVELSTGAVIRVFDGQTASVQNVVFSPDSRFVFSCGDSAVHQWDITTGKETRKFEAAKGNTLAMALSGDGRRLYTGGDDKLIHIWDVASGKEVHQPLAGHSDSITSLALTPDGYRLVSGSLDRTVRLWGLPR